MKKLIFLITFLALCGQVFSQTVVITDNAAYNVGNASSVLDVNSVLKGFLAPRMTQAQRTAISSPADGLLVYQTDATKGFYYYNGTSAIWTLLSASAGTFWSMTGNAGTNSSANYLGTTDAVSLRMRTNATQRVLLDSVGNVAIGTSPTFTAGLPREKFLVDAGSSATPNTSYNVIAGKGYMDNYLQLNIQNRAATANASSDVVASNDAATELVNYVDLGINSSGNTSAGVIGGASTAYLYSTGNDFAIGNGTASKNLLFFTGGTGANERMRIDGNGNVGIGTTAPLYKLHVSATTNPLYLTGVQTGAATDSILTIIGGVVRKISPSVSGSSTWNLAGNTGTNSSTNYLGTTDVVSLRMRTDAKQRVLIDSVGNVAIGTSPTFTAGLPREKFLVDAGSSTTPNTSYNVIAGKGYMDNYLQLNIQNRAATANASSDVVASNDAATELVNFVDLGINSSGNTSTGVLGGVSTAYLYSTGNDFAIGNATTAKNLLFFTNGASERMRITGSGSVGIATTTPAAILDVSGTYKLGSAGTVLTNMIKTSFNINDNSTFAYNSPPQVETVIVNGANPNANLIINPRTALQQGISIAWSLVTGANTVNVCFVNADATPRAVGNITFDVIVIQ